MRVLLIFLLAFPALFEARDCTVNNGDCSQQCIDRADGNDATCGCECYYQLDADNETCSLIDACGIDVLFMHDFTDGVMKDCAFNLLFNTPNNAVFEEWRNATADIFLEFDEEITDGTFVVGTMWSTNEIAVTHDYGAITSATTLRNEIAALTAVTGQICGDDYVFRELFFTFDNGQITGNAVILAPNNGGAGDNTTRIAIITMVRPYTSVTDEVLNTYAEGIHSYYDQVFVIGKKDTSQLATLEADAMDSQLRLMGCLNATSTSCPYVFYIDDTNDFGTSFVRASVLSMINSDSCVTRRATLTHTVSCGGSEMVISIPSCLLGGLVKGDLQLIDASCNGTTNAVVSGSEVVFTVKYEDCTPDISFYTTGGVEYINYTQIVTTINYGAGSNLKQLNFAATCVFPRFTDEQLGIVNPAVADLTDSVDETGSFSMDVILYHNDSYSGAYTADDYPLSISVLDQLYFGVEATLPDGLKIILTDVVATTDTNKSSSPSYTMLADKCVTDDTFSLPDAPDDAEVRFSVVMFEFSTTGDADNGAKDPVYFHVTIRVCQSADNSDECNQTCTTRKKRDVSGAEPAGQTKRIGPFYAGVQKTDESAPVRTEESAPVETEDSAPVETKEYISEDMNLKQEKGGEKAQPGGFQIYVISPSAGTMCFWFVLLLCTLLFFHLTWRCFSKHSSTDFVSHGCKNMKTPDDERKVNS